jgi:hypothetical protein
MSCRWGVPYWLLEHAFELEGPGVARGMVAEMERGELLPVLAAVCGRLAQFDTAGLDEDALREELRVAETAIRRLQARQAHLVCERTRRQTRRERERGVGPDRAAVRAARKVRRELAEEIGWTPSQGKQAQRVGSQAEQAPRAGAALDAGRLPAVHARILFDTLQHLVGEARARAEAELMAAAEQQHAVEFGRTCRRLLARVDHDAAADAEERRRDRRSGKVTDTEDGMLWASARVAGVDKALVRNAFHAFRRPDGPGERRSSEQATADAFIDICRAALKAAVAPTDHGVRPYVSVLLPYRALLEQAGVVEVEGAGPLPFAEVRRLLADCGVSRLLTDPRGVALEAGEQVRSVPAGVRRIVAARDGGCVAVGCDVPAAWCEVMHLGVPYRLGGRLTPETAALGCLEHHHKFDRRGWVITWIDGRPVLHHPRKPPKGQRFSRKGSPVHTASVSHRGSPPASTADGGERDAGPGAALDVSTPPSGWPTPPARPPKRFRRTSARPPTADTSSVARAGPEGRAPSTTFSGEP